LASERRSVEVEGCGDRVGEGALLELEQDADLRSEGRATRQRATRV
jgi:hypothetical protein